MRKKALQAQEKGLKGVVEKKPELIFNPTHETEAHWQQDVFAVEVAQDAEWRISIAKLD